MEADALACEKRIYILNVTAGLIVAKINKNLPCLRAAKQMLRVGFQELLQVLFTG